MTTDSLLHILSALNQNADPITGEAYGYESRLVEPEVHSALARLIRVVEKDARNQIDISDEEIREAIGQVAQLGYTPTCGQLAKLFYGSRTTVDDGLRGLPFFRRYRGTYSKRLLEDHFKYFRRRFPEELGERPRQRKAGRKVWSEIDYFRTDPFDKLSEEKAYELRQAIHALGFSKDTDRLPAYMQQARCKNPRAYEPWDRIERALLIEAMCYTNSLERLSAVFGRSARSLEEEGQRLIWSNKQRAA